MGGTHIEATRRESAIKDVRQSRGGFAEVMVERIQELGLDRGKIGILEVDPRFHDYLPVNQYHALKEALPDATSNSNRVSCTSWSTKKVLKSFSASARPVSSVRRRWRHWRS